MHIMIVSLEKPLWNMGGRGKKSVWQAGQGFLRIIVFWQAGQVVCYFLAGWPRLEVVIVLIAVRSLLDEG